jgi:NifU-like protein involved in Fe-S cluster formation
MGTDQGDICEEVISDHVRQPHDYQGLESATRTTEGVSRPWSDRFAVHLDLDHGRTDDGGFEGSRRAISHTSAWRMTTMSTGRSEAEAPAPRGDVHATITATATITAHLGRLAVRAGVTTSLWGSMAQRSYDRRFDAPSKSPTRGSPGSRQR